MTALGDGSPFGKVAAKDVKRRKRNNKGDRGVLEQQREFIFAERNE